MSKLSIESLPISEVHSDPANVRQHPPESIAAIKSSLKRFGQQKPIVIDARGVCRAGNGTLHAAKELGITASTLRPRPWNSKTQSPKLCSSSMIRTVMITRRSRLG